MATWLANLDLTLGDWLGLLGIGITLVQITRTRRSVRQIEAALQDASTRSGIYNVLVSAPRLSVIENQLDSAARSNDVETFSSLLRSYKELAAELIGLLHQESKHSAEATLKLNKSLTQATAAKLPATKTGTSDLYDRTHNVRKSISEASAETSMLLARLRTDLGPLDINDTSTPKRNPLSIPTKKATKGR